MKNAKVKINELKNEKLSAANAYVRGDLHSIYFSQDKKFGFIVAVNDLAQIGDEVELSQGPTKGLGNGVIVELI